MSAPFIIPFNFRPISVSVKTSSYTIPVGKYSMVQVECDSGGIFTIDGVNAVTTSPFINVDTTSFSSSLSYTVPANYHGNLSCFTSAGTGQTFAVNGNGLCTMSLNVLERNIYVGPSGTLSIAPGITATLGIQGVATPSNATNRQATFWVTTGTVISGSGNWRAVVMEYNIIS